MRNSDPDSFPTDRVAGNLNSMNRMRLISGLENLKIADSRSDSANRRDFCRVLEQELKPLYLLAFLLTANHKTAEKCFAATVEQALNESAALKDYVRFHIKRSLIRNAIAILSPPSAAGSEKPNPRRRGRQKAVGSDEIGAVTRLPPLERFVFVMSVLERYSDGECSLLLGCSTRDVAKARMRALRGLPEPVARSLRRVSPARWSLRVHEPCCVSVFALSTLLKES
jgi:DNA-directed RNA polymerase specialized sigma24 family protein